MKKVLLFIVLAFALVACGNNSNNDDKAALTGDPAIDNAYVDENVTDNGNKVVISDIEYIGEIPIGIPDRDGYEKSGYQVKYKRNGVLAQQDVYVYKKNDKIASFYLIFTTFFDKSNYTEEELAKIKIANCDVEVNSNKMISDCGNKEGEVVNKILNAIENKTYFDY